MGGGAVTDAGGIAGSSIESYSVAVGNPAMIMQ